jgi:hypothetical protein
VVTGVPDAPLLSVYLDVDAAQVVPVMADLMAMPNVARVELERLAGESLFDRQLLSYRAESLYFSRRGE